MPARSRNAGTGTIPNMRDTIVAVETQYAVVRRYFHDDVTADQQAALEDAAASLANAIMRLRAIELEWQHDAVKQWRTP